MNGKNYLNIIIVLFIIIIGKIISFVRNIIISYYFGASNVSDAFFAANNIPSIIYWSFISSYLVMLIPEYEKKKTTYGVIEANMFFSRYLTFIFIISLFLSLLSYYFIEILVNVIAPSFNQENKKLTVSLGKILVLSFPFTASYLSLAAISSTYDKFYAQHIIPIFSALFVIFGLYLFVEQYGIYTLAIAGVLATVIQVIIQILISKKHFKYSFQKKFIDTDIRKMSIAIIPIFIGYSVDQMNLLANSIISSGLSMGSLSAINYAQNIQLTISGVITTAMLTVLYPRMSKLSSEHKKDDVIETTWTSIRYLTIMSLPVILFLSFNAKNLIKIIYFRGRFSELALTQTSNILLFYLISIILLSIKEFITRFYYLSSRTTFPMFAGVISVLINIFFSYKLVADFGVAGLSLANLIATCLGLTLLAAPLLLRNKMYKITKDVKIFLLKICTSFLLMLFFHLSIHKYINSGTMLLFTAWLIAYSFVFYLILLLIRQQDAVQIFSYTWNKFFYVQK